jgi:hypothetical protein
LPFFLPLPCLPFWPAVVLSAGHGLKTCETTAPAPGVDDDDNDDDVLDNGALDDDRVRLNLHNDDDDDDVAHVVLLEFACRRVRAVILLSMVCFSLFL